jgi:hypothetical protein
MRLEFRPPRSLSDAVAEQPRVDRVVLCRQYVPPKDRKETTPPRMPGGGSTWIEYRSVRSLLRRLILPRQAPLCDALRIQSAAPEGRALRMRASPQQRAYAEADHRVNRLFIAYKRQATGQSIICNIDVVIFDRFRRSGANDDSAISK